MKNNIISILALMMFMSCHAQKKITIKTKTMDPIVTKEFEVFDTLKYKDVLNKKSFYFEGKLEDGRCFIINNCNAGLFYNETPSNSFFRLDKEYYSNGNIKSKGLEFNYAGFKKGTWYEFSEDGKLIKTIDYDKGFKFTWEDVIRFCEKEKIPLVKGYLSQTSGYHTSIKRSTSYILENVSTWTIEWLKYPEKQSSNVEILTLDGNTGKVVKKSWGSYLNN